MGLVNRPHSSWRKKAYQRVAERDGSHCQVCKKPEGRWCLSGGSYFLDFDSGLRATKVIWRPVLELDHRVPLHLGGTNDDDNLWLLCNGCHKAKTSAEQSVRLKALGAGRNAPR